MLDKIDPNWWAFKCLAKTPVACTLHLLTHKDVHIYPFYMGPCSWTHATALGISKEHYLGRRSTLGIQLIVLHTTSLLAEIGLPSNHSLGLSLDPMLWIPKLLPHHSLENLGKERVWVLFIFLVMNDANQTQLIPCIQEHSLGLGYLETRH